MRTVLGIDLGTQSLKTVFYEYGSREFVAVASSVLDVERRDDGSAEQHADWWVSALVDCLKQVPKTIRESVQAIGVSGQQHGFVPLGADGDVLAPVKLWCDTSTQAEVTQIVSAVGSQEQAIRLSGNPVVTGYTAPKILWLKNHKPELYARMTHILLPHDYLNYVLTGTLSMEFGDASGTGLMDLRTRTWSRPMLDALDDSRDLEACLPTLIGPDCWAGTLSANASRLLGLPEGTPVSSGGGDNMMGAIGTGNVKPGKLTMSLGSSGTLYAYSDKPVIDSNGCIAAFCSSTGGWLPLLCTMNCTLGTELIRELFQVSVSDFDAMAEKIAPGSDGLITLPFFNGERTPNLPNAHGSILGLASGNCSPSHMMRSVIEGATFALRFGLDELGRLGMDFQEIVLTGGGSKSAVWRQIVADVCNLPVTLLQQEEGASFGAALQALWVLQRQDNPTLKIHQITDEHLTANTELCVSPDAQSSSVYADSYLNYQRAVAQISPFY